MEEKESNEMIGQILDEIGLDFNNKIGPAKPNQTEESAPEEEDLQARLEKLRKS